MLERRGFKDIILTVGYLADKIMDYFGDRKQKRTVFCSFATGMATALMTAKEVMAVLRSFGMGKFAAAVMWVINEVFGGVNEKRK